MQDKLKELVKSYSIDWREYNLVGEHGIFQHERGVRQVKAERFAGSIPLVTAGYENAGVAEFVKSGNSKLFDENTLTIDMFGNPFYRGYKYYADDNIISLQNKSFSKNVLLYISSNLTYLTKFYNYGKQFRIEELRKIKIKLPTVNEEIAFDYIEEFIATMEAERLATLEAYLLATGLNDYELSEEEREVIGQFGNIEWHEFMNDELFEIFPSKSYSGLNDNQILKKNGKTPYVSNQSQDNGYIGWSNLEPLNEGGVITLSDTWQSERTIFYQPRPFIGKSHLQVMKPLMKEFDMYSAMFIISSFRKSILEMNYDYGTKFNRTKIKSTKIQLPVNDQEEPNFEFMTVLIKAIQKIVIKGVVEYLDKRIMATDEIINQ